jgi:transposase
MSAVDHDAEGARVPEDLPPVQPPSAGFILQLFVVPGLIVLAIVAVWLLFGKLAGNEQDWKGLLVELQHPNEHRRWRGALGLAQMLKADQGASGPAWDDARIAEALDVGLRTISRVRQRLVERGFAAVLERRPQEKPSTERKLDGAAEARLIALACSQAPAGRVGWTLQLLADKLVELKVVDAISDETVRRTLKKTHFSRGGRSSGAFRGSRAASSWRGWRT